MRPDITTFGAGSATMQSSSATIRSSKAVQRRYQINSRNTTFPFRTPMARPPRSKNQVQRKHEFLQSPSIRGITHFTTLHHVHHFPHWQNSSRGTHPRPSSTRMAAPMRPDITTFGAGSATMQSSSATVRGSNAVQRRYQINNRNTTFPFRTPMARPPKSKNQVQRKH